MRRFGPPHVIVTDLLRSYGAAMKDIGNADRQETGRWLNSRAENTHQPISNVSVQASVHNHFNQEQHLHSRVNFKLNRAAALAEWRGLDPA